MARTVKDAAYLLDAIAGPTEEDPRTAAAIGHTPVEGYVAMLSDTALAGRRFGLVGQGWRTSYLPLAPETEAFYRRAIAALQAEGGEVVDDPFLGSGFVEKYRERRGARSDGDDELGAYLRGLGNEAAFHSVEEWEALTGESFRGRAGRGGRAAGPPDSTAAERFRVETEEEAEETGLTFLEWRRQIQALFRQVLDDHDLDGLFFPQAGAPIPDLVEDPGRPDYNPNNHPELPSNIINDMGLPVVTVPFGYYADGTPFVLAFIGDNWTEAELLSYAFDFEQATKGRVPPSLVPNPGGVEAPER